MVLITQGVDFNPDSFREPVIGIASTLNNHDSLYHQHQRAQLLFAQQGVMTITIENQWIILPPIRAAWIPDNVRHRVQMRGKVAYRSLYFDCQLVSGLPQRAGVFSVNPLLRELIERIAFWPFDQNNSQSAAQHLLQVLQDELDGAQQQNTQLLLPVDRRVHSFITELGKKDNLPTLTALASHLNLHGKTLTRIFQRETGLSYQQWTQQWRLMRAVELLAEKHSISTVAQYLSFSSDSAFIAFFRQYTGTTPKRFMS